MAFSDQGRIGVLTHGESNIQGMVDAADWLSIKSQL